MREIRLEQQRLIGATASSASTRRHPADTWRRYRCCESHCLGGAARHTRIRTPRAVSGRSCQQTATTAAAPQRCRTPRTRPGAHSRSAGQPRGAGFWVRPLRMKSMNASLLSIDISVVRCLGVWVRLIQPAAAAISAPGLGSFLRLASGATDCPEAEGSLNLKLSISRDVALWTALVHPWRVPAGAARSRDSAPLRRGERRVGRQDGWRGLERGELQQEDGLHSKKMTVLAEFRRRNGAAALE